MPYMTDFMRIVKAQLAQLMLGISGRDWQTQSSLQTPSLKKSIKKKPAETFEYHLKNYNFQGFAAPKHLVSIISSVSIKNILVALGRDHDNWQDLQGIKLP